MIYVLLRVYSSVSVLSFLSFPASTWLPILIKYSYPVNICLSSCLNLTVVPLRINTSCSRNTTVSFCFVCAMYGSAVDRCSGPRFQEITLRLVCFWHNSRACCHCYCFQTKIKLHILCFPEASSEISSPHLESSL